MPDSGNSSWQDSPSTATPISAARLNNIETALDNAVDVRLADAKGDILAASGPDVFVKVPVGANGTVLTASSTATGGVGWGTVIASTANAVDKTILDAKGDIVVASAADAYSRLPVGSNGQVLYADSTQSLGVKWAEIPGSPSFGTTLPGSPADGAEHILVTTTTGASRHWRFRYNATSSSTYKWEFVGGTSQEVIGGDQSVNAGTVTWFSDWTCQYPGVYEVVLEANVKMDTGAAQMEIKILFNSAFSGTIYQGTNSYVTWERVYASRQGTLTSAGQVINVTSTRIGGFVHNIASPIMRILPVRISA